MCVVHQHTQAGANPFPSKHPGAAFISVCILTDHPPYPDVAIVCIFPFISQCAGTVRSGCK